MAQPCTRRSLADPSGLGLYSEFSFSWPANRRILYNRASADMNGKPWNPNKMLVEWDGSRWINNDVGDFVETRVEDGKVVPVPPNNKAFFMTWEQDARLFSYPMKDGPLPEHYEPYESPDEECNERSSGQPDGSVHEVERIRSSAATAKSSDRCNVLLRLRTLAVRYTDPQHSVARRNHAETFR